MSQSAPEPIDREIIYFWKSGEENGFLSNHFLCKQNLNMGACEVPPAEHAFMYYKALEFKDEFTASAVRKAKHPQRAKELGRSVIGFCHQSWDDVKENRMMRAMSWKFRDKQLCSKLLSTGDSILAEASPSDQMWRIGISREEAYQGLSWKGENKLGQLLMALRLELRARQDAIGIAPDPGAGLALERENSGQPRLAERGSKRLKSDAKQAAPGRQSGFAAAEGEQQQQRLQQSSFAAAEGEQQQQRLQQPGFAAAEGEQQQQRLQQSGFAAAE